MMKNKQQNILNSIINALPDNRPITSLQIVEEFEKCPKNFQPIHKTYDQDQDADLWRETSIFFSTKTCRYLCHSKTEGLPEYVVETIKVIGTHESTPDGFSSLSKTADSEQKAWRKRQIIYRLSKKGTIPNAVTDIILCSKFKQAPAGFTLAGDINGILICFKISSIIHRIPPDIPPALPVKNDSLIKGIENIQISPKSLYPVPMENFDNGNDYENLRRSFHISPKRPAPKPPVVSCGTLNIHTEIEGITFALNPALKSNTIEIPTLYKPISNTQSAQYDFNLERQILCTTKSTNHANPFFNN
uniref:Multivesicular body subunit 12A n=1 Tax=Corethrella appendiculata TaxID=1370023 RepID=U5EEK5_9DIPT